MKEREPTMIHEIHTYTVNLARVVREATTLYVEASTPEEAKTIAEYIAQNGKDQATRKPVAVDWEPAGIKEEAWTVACEELVTY
jgi:hypothetical protein